MDFIDQVKQLSQRVEKIKNSIPTEEATKMSLIIPFFQMLGYDVFNPEEFLPEFTADVGIKKGEKVDYAVIVNGEPCILIEAKWCGEALEKHDSQLFRYFGTTPAKFAILTNGIVYKFYTDLDEANRMDLTPFLEVDLLNLKENLVAEMKKFCKGSFNPNDMVSSASELKYSKAIKEYFAEQLKTPTDDFVRYFLGKVYDGVKTQSVIDRYAAIVKKALNDFIIERVNEKITSALTSSNESKEIIEEVQPEEPKTKINTTSEEIEAYYIIKSILADSFDPKRICYKDTENYFSVVLDGMITHWVCRLYLGGSNKFVIIPNVNKEHKKFSINDINDLYEYRNILAESASRFEKNKTRSVIMEH